MRPFFVVNFLIFPSILTSISYSSGFSAEKPDSVEERKHNNFRMNIPKGSTHPKEKPARLTAGEIEEQETLKRIMSESKDSLMNYQLGRINLSEAKDKKTDSSKASNLPLPVAKKGSLLNSDIALNSLNEMSTNNLYIMLAAEEKELVDNLCQEGVASLINAYTHDLLTTLMHRRKVFASERRSFELASMTGEIQLESEAIEAIQMNALLEEQEIERLQKAYEIQKEAFWTDLGTRDKIRNVIVSALQTFDISNEDDIENLMNQFDSKLKDKGNKGISIPRSA
jgi:hypothetical protein